MSNWQGFDQRKICPCCGGYETKLSHIGYRSKKSKRMSSILYIILVLNGGILIAVAVSQLLKGIVPPIGSVITLLFLFGSLLLSKRNRNGLVQMTVPLLDRSDDSEEMQEGALVGYHLYCWNCKHNWQMTVEEWETAGQNEINNIRKRR
jgi:hypothetical protein